MAARTAISRAFARPAPLPVPSTIWRAAYTSPARIQLSPPQQCRLPSSSCGLSSVAGMPWVPSKRWYSMPQEPAEDWTIVDFDKVKEISESTNSKMTIIDVREPDEYKQGHVPNAVNVPVNSSPDAMFLDPEAFEERFGFTKPDESANILVYCRAGVRSKASAGLARQAGFTNVNEYRGSWNDWVAKGGKVQS